MNLLLYLISIIYRLLVFCRNLLYNTKIIKPKVLDPAVISVGNLRAGGTGKTPFVELISKYILKQGKKIVIVSKGYNREHDDIKVVELSFKNEKCELSTENFGDEPILLLENLKETFPENGLLVVGDDKTKAAKFAAKKFTPDIIIIDDGFQHRKLYRDLDIVIINQNTDRKLLPAGSLREPFGNYKRADVIAINNKFIDKAITENFKNKPSVVCNYKFEGFYNYKNETALKETVKSAVIFSGIGDNNSFADLITGLGIKIDEFLQFSDHYNYKLSDAENILESFNRNNSTHILTTQKDFVRIKHTELVTKAKSENSIKKLLFNFPLFFAKIKMQITNNEEYLYKEIDKLIDKS
jgi:tetraacyldisaccharide 4'-kinase